MDFFHSQGLDQALKQLPPRKEETNSTFPSFQESREGQELKSQQ